MTDKAALRAAVSFVLIKLRSVAAKKVNKILN